MYTYDHSSEKDFKRNAILKKRPKGIIIFDTFNNEWFPLEAVEIDTNMYNLRVLKDEFHRIYGGSAIEDLFMPWHYTVEFIGKSYNVSSTRPIMYKSLIPGYEEYISVCIVGNSNKDMYTKELYKVIAATCLNSLHYIPGWRLNPDGNTQYLNLGKNFKVNQLEGLFR